MSFLDAMKATTSALTAQRLRMDVISSNVANADTTRTTEGGPYKRRAVVFQSGQGTPSFQTMLAHYRSDSNATFSAEQGVTVSNIITDPSPGRVEYDPTNPDANAEGLVEYPNVDTMTEIIDLVSATRAYEANVTVANALKSMAVKALDIGKA